MQLSAILLARFVALIETVDLDPHGRIHYPTLVHGLVERLKFQKYPKAPEEIDESKGIVFTDGLYNGIAIQKLTIFNNGLVIETRSSTQDSEKILQENLIWATKEFGLAFSPEAIKRKMYVSQLTFTSTSPILAGLSTSLAKLAKILSATVVGANNEKFNFETTGISIGHDVLTTKYPVASLTIQRRLETPFSENKYFSEAPLQTDIHLSLIQALEDDLKR